MVAELHHFKRTAQGFFHSLLTILIDVFHCANQSLDVDCLLSGTFWSRRGFKAPRRESALSVAVPGEFRAPYPCWSCAVPRIRKNFFAIGKTVQKRIVDMNPVHVCRAKLFVGTG
jgi:hypothetical protein